MKDQTNNQVEFQRRLNELKRLAKTSKVQQQKNKGEYQIPILERDGQAFDITSIFCDYLIAEYSANLSTGGHVLSDIEKYLASQVADRSDMTYLVAGYKTSLPTELHKRAEVETNNKILILRFVATYVAQYLTARIFLNLRRKTLIEGLAGKLFPAIDNKELIVSWSLKLVEMFTDCFADEMDREVTNDTYDSKRVDITWSEEFKAELERHETELMETVFDIWPMEVQPKEWSQYTDTPFHDENIKKTMINKKKEDCTNSTEYLAKTLNSIQNIRYEINNTVLVKIQECLDNKNYEVFKSKKHGTLSTRPDQKLALAGLKRTVACAAHFADKSLWHVVTADFRGRVYYACWILNPVGDDVQKALHLAGDKVKVGTDAARAYYVSLANALGEDKLPINKRIEFAKDLHTSGTLREWFNGNDGWEQADSPFQALAIAEDILKWEDSGFSADYESGLLVGIDATISGLQMCAGALKDKALGKYTNLAPVGKQGEQEREDLYLVVAKGMQRLYRVKKTDPEYKQVFARELGNRKHTKRPTMTLTYGLTTAGSTMYFYESFLEYFNVQNVPNKWLGVSMKPFERQEDSSKVDVEFSAYRTEIQRVQRYFETVMAQKAPAAFEILDTIKEWARQLTQVQEVRNSLTISWDVPNGITVSQRYEKEISTNVRAYIKGREVRHTTYKPTGIIKSASHSNAIVANVVHSCDAKLLHLIAAEMSERGMPSAYNHDNFFSTIGNFNQLNDIVRVQFIEFCNSNPLEQIRLSMSKRYGVSLRELPETGTLNLNKIRKGDHCFS